MAEPQEPAAVAEEPDDNALSLAQREKEARDLRRDAENLPAVRADRGMVRVVGKPGDVVEVLGEYRQVQQALDAAMPDCIMTIQGRPFRKKKYWRGVKTQFGVSVEIVKPFWLTLQRKDGTQQILPYRDESEVTVPGGDDIVDWGFQVMCRAVHNATGIYQDGIGACSMTEKLVYAFDWETGRSGKSYKKYHKDERGKRIVDVDGTADNASIHNVLTHAQTRAENRAIADLVGFGEVSAEEMPPRAMGTRRRAPQQATTSATPASVADLNVGPEVVPLGRVTEIQALPWEIDDEGGYKKWLTLEGLEGRVYTTSNPFTHQWWVGSELQGVVSTAKRSKKGWPYAVGKHLRRQKGNPPNPPPVENPEAASPPAAPAQPLPAADAGAAPPPAPSPPPSKELPREAPTADEADGLEYWRLQIRSTMKRAVPTCGTEAVTRAIQRTWLEAASLTPWEECESETLLEQFLSEIRDMLAAKEGS